MREKEILLLQGQAREKHKNDLQARHIMIVDHIQEAQVAAESIGFYLDRPENVSMLQERLIPSFSEEKGDPSLLLLYGEDIPFGYADRLQEKLPAGVEVVRMAILYGQERALIGGNPTGKWVKRIRRQLAEHGLISLICRPIEVDETLRQIPAFLDWKSRFYVRLGELCDQSQARLEVVAQALGMDTRIGQGWLPEEDDVPQQAAEAERDRWLLREFEEIWRKAKISRIAFWGSEPQLKTIENKLNVHVEVNQCDPLQLPKTNELAALTGTLEHADLLIIRRASPIVRGLDLQELVSRMSRPLVLDACSCYPLTEADALQIGYRTFGQNTNVWEWNGL
ncbi:MAG TPA: hypothetical protein VE710_17410 [Candidatus Bathyarchaeia archaeon]|nr:hypothetical protein [Candidatus Bathyarchaeia archaeon]